MEGRDPITSLTIYGVWVNVSLRTISKFLNGTDFHPSVNIEEINNCMEEIQKVTKNKIGSNDKIMHLDNKHYRCKLRRSRHDRWPRCVLTED